MLKIGTVKWQGRCARHPSFDPDADGPGGVKGDCPRCLDLIEIYESQQRTLRLMRAFGLYSGHRRKTAQQRELDRQQNLFGAPL